MSWTIVCDLAMDKYHDGLVLDSTSHQNNAKISGPVSKHRGYISFRGADAQLEIPAIDESLTSFGALRIQAFVRPQPISHRYNIIEGWMSFALFIESDGSLTGTVYDGHRWVGPNSGQIKVPINKWSRVCLEYDGVSILSLKLNGRIVGSRLDISSKILPPRQVITLGHWPRGDGRYTLKGDLGHIRIEKRDQQDYWRDTLTIAYCRRKLNPAQLRARREMEYLLSTLPPREQERLQKCSQKQMELLRAFLHKLRGRNPKEVAIMRRVGNMLLKAWCCSLDEEEARKILVAFFRSLKGMHGGARELEQLFEEFLQISSMCQKTGHPYDRIQELFFIVFPELRSYELVLRDLIRTA